MLSGFETVKICTGYRADGERLRGVPAATSRCSTSAEPIYEELDGWNEEIDEATSFEDLPKEARAYVTAHGGARGGARDRVVSVGPAREQSLPVG